MRVALIGGGSSAHLAAVLLSGRGHEVRVLTSRPALWNHELVLETPDGILRGRIAGAGNDPAQIVGVADVAILCMPVHQYCEALDRIMPVLAVNRDCIVGTVYGQGGFDWMVKVAAQKFGYEVPRHFAIGLLPWIARTVEYGKRAISYGPKMCNGIATSGEEVFNVLQERLLDDLSYSYWDCGRFERIPNFATITLTVDNQIIHPSRCFALAQECDGWDDPAAIPYFYRDWDDFSAEILKGVDGDYSTVRKRLVEKFPSLKNPYSLNYLALEHWSYGSHNPDIKASFVNSQTLGAIKPPVMRSDDGKWRLDVENRFFKDDFVYGLEVCKWVADQLECPVPNVDKLLAWYVEKIKPLQHVALGYDILQNSSLGEFLGASTGK